MGLDFFWLEIGSSLPKSEKLPKNIIKKKHLLAEVQWKLSDLVFYFDFCCFQKKETPLSKLKGEV